MSFVFQEELRIDDATYTIDTYPLESYPALLPTRPQTCVTPFNQNG
jgi:hypothetical protein